MADIALARITLAVADSCIILVLSNILTSILLALSLSFDDKMSDTFVFLRGRPQLFIAGV